MREKFEDIKKQQFGRDGLTDAVKQSAQIGQALALVLFAYGAGALGGPVGGALLHGLKLIAVAIVAQAV
jgi:hypothetical protein